MRCAICDKILEEPIKINPRTQKPEPCTECMEVIQKAIKQMERRDDTFDILLPTITTDTWEDMTQEDSIKDVLQDNDIFVSLGDIRDDN